MGQLSCPKCGGVAEGGRGCFIWLLVILFFPIGLVLLLLKPTYKCQNCGFMFKAAFLAFLFAPLGEALVKQLTA